MPTERSRSDPLVAAAFLIASITAFAYVGLDVGHLLGGWVSPVAARFVEGTSNGVMGTDLASYRRFWWLGFLLSEAAGIVVGTGLLAAWARLAERRPAEPREPRD